MNRRGYTLVEVLLVLALLVLAAALAAPAALSGGAWSKLQKAADDVSTLWGRARLDAAASGKTLVFRCETGGRHGEVSNPIASAEGVAAAVHTIDLDESLVFHTFAVAEPAGSVLVGIDAATSEESPSAVFRSDGATSDAELIIQHEGGRQIKVVLRGVTGSARIVEDFEPVE